jgi:putative FmdB family regulatory protein
MPTYEYNCEACGHSFDELQSFSAAVLKKCPKCGKLKLVRAFGTGGAVVFKGSGFYETDCRSDKYKNAAKADQEPAKTEAAPKPKEEAKGGSEKKSEKKSPKSGE